MKEWGSVGARLFKDWLTALDGETYAIGRGLGVTLFLILFLMLAGVTIFVAVTRVPSAAEWGEYMTGVAFFVGSVGATAWALIRGTAATEPIPPEASKSHDATP